MKVNRKRWKRKVTLLVITALLIGILPMEIPITGKAEASVLVGKMVRAGYGLNNPRTDSDGVVTWDCVWFGNYCQEDTNGDGKADKSDAKQPIKWRVLSVNGDDAFLVADKNLDVQRYNDTYTSVTWETCTMRSWLNGYGAGANKEGKDYSSNNFLIYAFSADERSAIRNTDVVNNDNSYYDTEGGNDTSDQVYLLSVDEVMNPFYGFASNVDGTQTRKAINTAYVAGGGEINGNISSAGSSGWWWWLRSPGRSSNIAACVSSHGYVSRDGYGVIGSIVGVRPALHLNLSSISSWSYAGTVTSNGGDTGSATPTPGTEQGSSGLVCAPNRTVEVGGSVSLNARVFASTKEKMVSCSSNVSWESSDQSIATVQNAGFIQATEATKYKGTEGETALWWASGLIIVKGKKAGDAVITGTLADGSTVNCHITVIEPETSSSSDSEGNAGCFVLGEDQNGSADDGKGVAKFFPASWSLKSSKYPVQMSQSEDKDGNYTLKVSVGIGRSDILDKDTEWSTYKKACDAANKSSSSQDQLESYRDLFGLKGSAVIHSSGWKGEKKPKLSVMGYVECKYDKYGNIISNTGTIAGDLKWSGDISWQFATPIGPMYLKLGAEGKASLKMEPSWNKDENKLKVDGKLTLTPAISLTGGYGIDKVASLSATGKAALDVQVWPPSKATFTAEASVNVYALFIIDYTWTLAKYTSPPLWNTVKAKNYMGAKSYMSAGEETEPQFIRTDFADEKTGWLGHGENAHTVMVNKKDLQKGLLPSSLPMLAQMGGKQVLVWQEYDKTRDMANSVVLMYSVLQNGAWSDPAAVCDDGSGDGCADLQVIGGKICLTWQKHKMGQTAGEASEAVAAMAESAEIYYAEFDEESDTFTAVTQVTDNALCDMMPRFVSGLDEVQIAWVRNEANSILQSEGINSIYVSGKSDFGFEPEQKLTDSPGTIDRYVSYQKDGVMKAVYVTKADGLVAVRDSDNMVEDALSDLMLEAGEGTVSAMNYVDGKLQLISNGILYRYDPATGKMASYEAGNAAFDGTAVYCSNGAKSGYIWSIYDKEEDKGSILASMQTGEGYSDPVTIYETKGEISRCISPVLTEDGEWNIALNQEETENGSHILSYVSQKEKKEMNLLSAYVQEHDVSGGKTGVEYVFTNTGDAQIDEILVQVTLADGTVIRETVQQNVNPGATVTGTAYLDLSAAEKGQDIQIAVCEADQTPNSKNTVSDRVEQSDIALVGTATEDDQGIQITAYATNQGTRAAKTSIRLFGETEKKTELASQKGLEVAPGQTEKVSFTIAPDKVKYSDKGTAYLTLYADVEDGDYELSNNTSYLALYEGEEVYANTEEKDADHPVTGEEGRPTGTLQPSPAASPKVSEKPDAGSTLEPSSKPDVIPSFAPDTTFAPEYLPPIIAPGIPPSNPPDAGSIEKVSAVKLKQKKKSATVSWKKVSGATGYQICYSTSKKWKNKKQKLTQKNKLTVKKLKKKKIYYFRVRAYRINGAKKVYGAWSKTKKITTKK